MICVDARNEIFEHIELFDSPAMRGLIALPYRMGCSVMTFAAPTMIRAHCV